MEGREAFTRKAREDGSTAGTISLTRARHRLVAGFESYGDTLAEANAAEQRLFDGSFQTVAPACSKVSSGVPGVAICPASTRFSVTTPQRERGSRRSSA